LECRKVCGRVEEYKVHNMTLDGKSHHISRSRCNGTGIGDCHSLGIGLMEALIVLEYIKPHIIRSEHFRYFYLFEASVIVKADEKKQ